MKGMKGISRAQYWHCPSCKVSVTLYVEPVAPPTHPCPKKGKRTTNLQQQKEENNEQ